MWVWLWTNRMKIVIIIFVPINVLYVFFFIVCVILFILERISERERENACGISMYCALWVYDSYTCKFCFFVVCYSSTCDTHVFLWMESRSIWLDLTWLDLTWLDLSVVWTGLAETYPVWGAAPLSVVFPCPRQSDGLCFCCVQEPPARPCSWWTERTSENRNNSQSYKSAKNTEQNKNDF